MWRDVGSQLSTACPARHSSPAAPGHVLRSGASADEVLARAEADGAPFTQAEPLKAWVAQGLAELS
jgi:hypothetical protein